MTAGKSKRSVQLVWSKTRWSNSRKEILDYSEMRAVVVCKEGIAPVVTLFKRKGGHIFYTIYLDMNDDRRILIAKGRSKKGAKSLATVIARFLNLEILHSESLQ